MTTTLRQSRKTGYKHPWPLWFRKTKFTLVRGVDYACMSHGFAQQVRNVAASARYRLSVSVDIEENPERVTVEVHGPLPRSK